MIAAALARQLFGQVGCDRAEKLGDMIRERELLERAIKDEVQEGIVETIQRLRDT